MAIGVSGAGVLSVLRGETGWGAGETGWHPFNRIRESITQRKSQEKERFFMPDSSLVMIIDHPPFPGISWSVDFYPTRKLIFFESMGREPATGTNRFYIPPTETSFLCYNRLAFRLST